MASNAKWRARLEIALLAGDMTFWENNKGFLSTGEAADLESAVLSAKAPAPAVKVPAKESAHKMSFTAKPKAVQPAQPARTVQPKVTAVKHSKSKK
jgi:hypothetical protein|tara:strand:- start:134 stop:421 length:288 start_codon:yes stop_codon:yes gene_type:complete